MTALIPQNLGRLPAALNMAQALGDGEVACLVIRHAARHAIPAGEVGTDVQLTDEGVEAALQAGVGLRGLPVARILTSPLQRCVDTGRLLAAGLGSGITPEVEPRLGDGGLFVHDVGLAQVSLSERGALSTVWQLLASDAPPSGFARLQDGMEASLAWITDSLARGLTIMVTHDSNIAAIAGGLFGQGPVAEAWPGFLDGLLFRTHGGRLTAHYRDRQAAVTPKQEGRS